MNERSHSTRYENPRLRESEDTNACDAVVRWSPVKSLWISSMYAGTLLGAALHFTWPALALFMLTSAITLCAGHSVGMHRLLIHRSFESPKWLERTLVYLGTLVGLGGPWTMARTHDLRDWAQRQSACHDYFGHRSSFFKDAYWQMHCDLALTRPQVFEPESAIKDDRFYRLIERTHMAQQLPWAIVFVSLGGWSWLLWGICARVAVSVTGHWLIGYFAHNRGGQQWHVDGAAVQGFDVDYCGLITFGECWHNNHHAFPRSAKIGLYDGQLDPGWWLIKLLASLGLAKEIKTPELLPHRPELIHVTAVSDLVA